MLLRLVALLAMVCMAQAFVATQSRWLASIAKLNAIKVSVSEEEPIENVLKRFKKTVNQSGHLMDLRFKEHWETAADKKKRKTERARQLNRIERTNDRYERRNDNASEYNS